MSSIGYFPCEYTKASEITGELADKLGLQLYTDSQLFEEAAELSGSTPERLKKMMYEKTSVFNQFTLEREQAVNIFRLVLADKLKMPENYLFYGLHVQLIPQEVSEVLRVLVVDGKQLRIQRAVEDGVAEKNAKKQIKKHDTSAFAWTDFLFKMEAYDAKLYDLVIPMERQTPGEVAQKIEEFFHKTSVLRTEASQAAVSNMKTAALVTRNILEAGHKIPVVANGSTVTFTLDNSVFNLSGLQKELTGLAKEIDESLEVNFRLEKTDAASVYRQQKFELPSKVLFVDDEKDFVQTVSQRLISRDVGTYGVFNGEEALDIIREDKPDVIVLDLKMPGLYGTDVLREAKQIAPEVEVIILTGHGSIKDEQECMALGAFAYLNKPVDIEQLSETIKAANEKAHQTVSAK